MSTEPNRDSIQHWADAAEQVREAWTQMAEALLPAFQALFDALSAWWVEIKRHYFYLRLRHWHFPHSLAYWLAQHWPRRLLPYPDFDQC